MIVYAVQANETPPPTGRHYADLTTPCEIVVGGRTSAGYCYARAFGGPRHGPHRRFLAHRFIWELYVGPIPEGMVVQHRCDRSNCVTLDHLELGSTAENNADAIRRSRRPSRITLDDEAAIFRRYRDGDGSLRSLAVEFGVSKRTVQQILDRLR